MKRITTVDEYIEGAPKDVQNHLRQIRAIIRVEAPKATEKISYGMPYYGYNGRLVYFAYSKNHIGFYGMPWVLDDFKNELKEYRTGKATIRFLFDKKLPTGLIRKLVRRAVQKNEKNKR